MDNLSEDRSAESSWSEYNRIFHETINNASGLPRLCEAISIYRDKVDRYVRRYFSMGGRVQSQKDHWSLYRALENERVGEAKEIILSHSNSTATLLVAAIRASHDDVKISAAAR